jgi:MoxR-like ATPase
LRPGHPIDALQAAVAIEDVLAAQKAVREVNVDAKVRDYILQLVHATRAHEAVRLGGSPRSTLALYRAAQAYAAMQGDDYVLPDYVKIIAPHVLPHRLVVKPESRLRRVTGAGVVEEIVRHTPVPMLAAGR